MARYTYNAGLVTQTIDTLYAACDCLDSTNVDIKKGIDTIWNARGAENMNIDFSPITGYQSSVIECVESMASELKKKAQEIEEYQDAPWYKKLFATIGMGALKIVEGLATFVENIGDGLVSIVGFIGGIFSSNFKNSVAEFVRTDWVGDTTAKWYDEGWLQGLDKYSYMSHESTAANILKGVGTAAGYVILTVATAGAGTAVSLGVSTAAAAAGGIGSGTENALKQAQLANPEMSAGDAFNSAFGQGVKQGAIAAGTTLLTAGVAKGLQNVANGAKFATFADDIANTTKGVGKVAAGAQKIINAGVDKIMSNGVGNKILTGAGKILNGAGGVMDDIVDDVGGAVFDKVVGKGVIGNALAQGAVNMAGNGGAIVANTIGTVVGASGQFKKNVESAEIDLVIDEVSTPSAAQQMYTEAQEVLKNEENLPDVATEEEAENNRKKLTEEGYTPAPTGTPAATGSPTPSVTATATSPGGPIGTEGPRPTTPTGTKPSITAPEVTMPTQPQQTTAPSQTPAVTTTAPYTKPDDVIGTLKPNDPTPRPTGTNPNISTLTDPDKITENTTEKVGSEVLNTFGEVSGSLSGLSSTKSSIPTSSSPILSSDGGNGGSKFVPLGAGLGAASIAGIGAKAYLDKREKASSEEESDELETEEWASQDDMEIDYGLESNSEEADYLSPTDELAFTE